VRSGVRKTSLRQELECGDDVFGPNFQISIERDIHSMALRFDGDYLKFARIVDETKLG